MPRRSPFLPLCLLLTALALLLRPDEAAAGAREGLTLCAETVLPALFPFLVLSGLVVELGFGEALGRRLGGGMRLFGLGGGGASALVLGLVGGYPLGARTVGELYRRGTVSKGEAERLLLFCNNAGPAFLLSVVGVQLFGSRNIGWLLLLTHGASAILTGVLTGRLARRPPEAARETAPLRGGTETGFPEAFSAAVRSAVSASLNICACVTLFAVALRLLRLFGLLSLGTQLLVRLGAPEALAEALLSGVLELTNGVATLPRTPSLPTLTAAAFLLGFGGLSVFCQTASLLAGSGLSPVWCLKGQLCHGILAALLTAGVAALWPEGITAFSSAASGALTAASFRTAAAVTGIAGWGAVAVVWGMGRRRNHFSGAPTGQRPN